MIKFIIFDLDGVLLDCKGVHFECLNKAITRHAPGFEITKEEHLSKYDGLPTKRKLEMLSELEGFPVDKIIDIRLDKQELTLDMMRSVAIPNIRLSQDLEKLSDDGYEFMCASNSVTSTVAGVLKNMRIAYHFLSYWSNNDVSNPKPHPEIYMKAMLDVTASPKETLIIEDSHVGRRAAYDSGAYVLGVKNCSEVNYENIISRIKEIETVEPTIPKWTNKQLNVLIPMAGKGSRFVDAGYTFPKPLIEVDGMPMIQKVVENLNIDAQYTYIVRHEDYEKYNLQSVLSLITPGCNIVEVEGPSEGAAWHTLFAMDHIYNENPLVIANSDQLAEWDSNEFLYAMSNDNIDGGILTFKSTHPKWSFAKTGDDGFVSEVAEKNPISDDATVGIYYFRTGKLYVDSVNQMIDKDIRTNGEYYVCPVYNEIIGDGGKVRAFSIDKIWGLGTPEDLNTYIGKH